MRNERGPRDRQGEEESEGRERCCEMMKFIRSKLTEDMTHRQNRGEREKRGNNQARKKCKRVARKGREKRCKI